MRNSIGNQKLLKNHPAIQNSGINIHDSSNVKYLPTKTGIDPNPNLSVHKGSHPKYTASVKKDLDKVMQKSKGKNWSQAQYKKEIDKVIDKNKKLLDKGKIKCK